MINEIIFGIMSSQLSLHITRTIYMCDETQLRFVSLANLSNHARLICDHALDAFSTIRLATRNALPVDFDHHGMAALG